ncbi:hypothetical protein CMUS01_07943 [Colletotrichum musicola]|uniref:Fungal-type protein kinase domain-containing protein n=1 Tax=Colletotrichum musicola TaxID=2175873 RepID=A0A8H6KER0_9PEZI|nr:hypothetical protein CMUS01_07943 [Colletotrichum musicola]
MSLLSATSKNVTSVAAGSLDRQSPSPGTTPPGQKKHHDNIANDIDGYICANLEHFFTAFFENKPWASAVEQKIQAATEEGLGLGQAPQSRDSCEAFGIAQDPDRIATMIVGYMLMSHVELGVGDLVREDDQGKSSASEPWEYAIKMKWSPAGERSEAEMLGLVKQRNPRGVLIDLDVAKKVSESWKQFDGVGTPPFKVIGVLQACLPDNSHTYRHDLESFFYTFLFLATCERPVASGRTSSTPCQERFSLSGSMADRSTRHGARRTTWTPPTLIASSPSSRPNSIG